jgi:hypothetical protein
MPTLAKHPRKTKSDYASLDPQANPESSASLLIDVYPTQALKATCTSLNSLGSLGEGEEGAATRCIQFVKHTNSPNSLPSTPFPAPALSNSHSHRDPLLVEKLI